MKLIELKILETKMIILYDFITASAKITFILFNSTTSYNRLNYSFKL